jgi:hypothetical protein
MVRSSARPHGRSIAGIKGRTECLMTWNSEDESTLSSIPRWLMFTGERGQLQPQKHGTWASTYGWTGRPDGRTVSFSDCARGEIIFGGEAGRRITSLIAQGKAYTLAVYPGAEHGMTAYELNANGERISTRFAPGYFQMMADFAREGCIGRRYGNAQITGPH